MIESIPRIGAFNHLIASWQIRNRATVSGNIVNASPIGDFTVLLLALDARVVLDGGGSRRSVPLKDFYHGYKQLDLRPGELLTEVAFADPADARVNFEKVSKRTCLDIASVNSACSIRCIGDTIVDAHVSLGGVAPVPLYLHQTSHALTGPQPRPGGGVGRVAPLAAGDRADHGTCAGRPSTSACWRGSC